MLQISYQLQQGSVKAQNTYYGNHILKFSKILCKIAQTPLHNIIYTQFKFNGATTCIYTKLQVIQFHNTSITTTTI